MWINAPMFPCWWNFCINDLDVVNLQGDGCLRVVGPFNNSIKVDWFMSLQIARDSTIIIGLLYYHACGAFHTIAWIMMTSSNGNIFRATGPFVRGIHQSPVNSPHKGQWRWALMFPLICVWINGWVNNLEAGDLRRHSAHCDVIVMNHDFLWDVTIKPYSDSTPFV